MRRDSRERVVDAVLHGGLLVLIGVHIVQAYRDDALGILVLVALGTCVLLAVLGFLARWIGRWVERGEP